MSFVVLRKIVTLNFFKIMNFTLLLLLINANNDRFAVLCNRYFSECDWRFIWCQFVADVKGNPGWFPVTVKYRRPYASTVVTPTAFCASWPRFGRAVVNSNRAHNSNRAVGRRAFR